MASPFYTEFPERKSGDGPRPDPGSPQGTKKGVSEKTAGWGLKGLPTQARDRANGIPRVKKYVTADGL